MVEEGFTWRDQSGRSLTLSGQVNPAFNVVDDGISTDVFIIDNDTSSSKFRLDVEAPLGETSLGGTLEVGASPNNSNSVSQLDPQVAAEYDVKKAEVGFRNDRYGRVLLGKGSSAADDAAEYDLSLVAGSIMYAGGRFSLSHSPIRFPCWIFGPTVSPFIRCRLWPSAGSSRTSQAHTVSRVGRPKVVRKPLGRSMPESGRAAARVPSGTPGMFGVAPVTWKRAS